MAALTRTPLANDLFRHKRVAVGAVHCHRPTLVCRSRAAERGGPPHPTPRATCTDAHISAVLARQHAGVRLYRQDTSARESGPVPPSPVRTHMITYWREGRSHQKGHFASHDPHRRLDRQSVAMHCRAPMSETARLCQTTTRSGGRRRTQMRVATHRLSQCHHRPPAHQPPSLHRNVRADAHVCTSRASPIGGSTAFKAFTPPGQFQW